MSERLPRELRILSDVTRGVAGPVSAGDAAERLCAEIRSQFGFDDVRFVGDDADRDELVLLDAALESRRAVTSPGRVAVPLLDDGARCLGYLVADRGGAPLALTEADLQLLSTLGYLGGVLIANAGRNDQTMHLSDLTGQPLDLSRLDSGRRSVELRPFDLLGAVEALVSRVVGGAGPSVEIAIEPGCVAVSDLLVFERVVGNLLANAVKDGGGTIAVHGDRHGVVVSTPAGPRFVFAFRRAAARP